MNTDQNRDRLSPTERRRYAVATIVCWILFAGCLSVFALVASSTVKFGALVCAVLCLLIGVVFNVARRFDVRVLWSNRFRA
jgi:hypothetical protein